MILSACRGGAAPPPATTAESPTEPPTTVSTRAVTTTPGEPEIVVTSRPPALIVHAGDESARLRAWSYCWSDGNVAVCADGVPPQEPRTLIVDEPITFEWPVSGATLQISSAFDGSCPQRRVSISLTDPFVPFDCDVLDITAIAAPGDASYRIRIETSLEAAVIPGPELSWAFVLSDVEPLAGAVPEVSISNFDGEITTVEGVFSLIWQDFVLELPVMWENFDEGTLLWADINFGETDVPPQFLMIYNVEINGTEYSIGSVTWPDDFSPGTPQGPVGSLIPAD